MQKGSGSRKSRFKIRDLFQVFKTPTPIIRSHDPTSSSWYTLAKLALGFLSADVGYAYRYEWDRDKRIDAVLERTDPVSVGPNIIDWPDAREGS